jgi:pentatricopeptide repeat protein
MAPFCHKSLSCLAACLLVFAAWAFTSGGMPKIIAQHSDVLVLAACVAAFLLGSAREGSRTPDPAVLQLAGPDRALERTVERFEGTVKQGCRPDRASLNAALSAHAQLGRVSEARQLFEQMPSFGLAPDAKAYSTLIRAYASNNRAQEAMALFESMREAGVKPTRFAYHDAVCCSVKLQKLEEAITLYNEMVRSRVAACGSTCQCLSHACRKRGWTDIADQIIEDMARGEKTLLATEAPPSDASTEFRDDAAGSESD